MLNQSTNLRQADEAAAPGQTFKTPQDEIRHIQQTNRTLAGFTRILEIIRDADFFRVYQGTGGLDQDWLTGHSHQCSACVGALLSWFFAGPKFVIDREQQRNGLRIVRGYDYHDGQELLARHLNLSEHRMRWTVVRAMRRTLADPSRNDEELMRCMEPSRVNGVGPFCAAAWPVDYAAVFRELAREFPGK